MLKFRFLAALIIILAITTPALAVDDYCGPSSGASHHSRLGNASAHRGDSPWEESYTQDIDMTAFLGRLYDVLTKDEYLGQYPQVKQVAGYLSDSGFFSMATDHCDYQITGDSIRCASFKGFKDLDPASYYGRYLALPDMQLRSAQYVAEDDVMLYLALTNVHQKVMLEAENLAASSKATGGNGPNPLDQLLSQFGGGDAEQLWQLVKALRLDQVVSGVITGEVALAVYGLPPADKLVQGDFKLNDADVALMIGINDPKYLIDMIEKYGGEIGLQGEEMEGGWHSYAIPQAEGLVVMFNDEMLIATTNADKLKAHMAKAAEGGCVDVDACQLYCDINMARLHNDLALPLYNMAQADFGSSVELPAAATAYLLNLPEPAALGHVRLMSYHEEDGLGWEMTLQKALPQYMLYYGGVLGCGMAQKKMSEQQEQASPDEPEAAPAAPEAAPQQ
jgi:hypothetical protein